jgi:hypothetical protein
LQLIPVLIYNFQVNLAPKLEAKTSIDRMLALSKYLHTHGFEVEGHTLRLSFD